MDASGHYIDNQPVSEDTYRREMAKLLQAPLRTEEQEDEHQATQEGIQATAQLHALQARLQRATGQPVRPVRPMAVRRGQ